MMMKKYVLFISILCLLLFAFVSCGGGGGKEAYAADYEAIAGRERSVSYQEMSRSDTAFAGSGYNSEMPSESASAAQALNVTDNRKLIKTTNLILRVDDLNEAAETIGAIMQNYGAYSSSTQIEENRQTYYIRVPESSYETMLDQVNGLGKVSRRTDSIEDATLQYYDLEGRLNTRKELLQTYQSYLSKADNIEEILSVEKKIAELQNEIDMYGSRFTQLVNQIDYASIILTLYGTVSGYGYQEPSIWDRVKDLFSGYGDFLSGALIVIIQIIVYGIPVLIAVTLAFWLLFGKIGLLRKLWRLAAKKKE